MFFIQHCFICCPLDSPVSEDPGIEPRIVATLALPVRRSNHSACEAISSFLIFTLQMGEVGTEKALAAHQILPVPVPTVPGPNRPRHFHQCHQVPGRNVLCFLYQCPRCRDPTDQGTFISAIKCQVGRNTSCASAHGAAIQPTWALSSVPSSAR
jgi:hypothetical protein